MAAVIAQSSVAPRRVEREVGPWEVGEVEGAHADGVVEACRREVNIESPIVQ